MTLATGMVRLTWIVNGKPLAHHRFSGDVGPKRDCVTRRRDLLRRPLCIVGN